MSASRRTGGCGHARRSGRRPQEQDGRLEPQRIPQPVHDGRDDPHGLPAAHEICAHGREQRSRIDLVGIDVSIDQKTRPAGQEVEQERSERQERRRHPGGMRRAQGRIDTPVDRDDGQEHDAEGEGRRDAVDHAAVHEAADAEDVVAKDRVGERQGDGRPRNRGHIGGRESAVHGVHRNEGERHEGQSSAGDAGQRDAGVASGTRGLPAERLPRQHEQRSEDAAREVDGERDAHRTIDGELDEDGDKIAGEQNSSGDRKHPESRPEALPIPHEGGSERGKRHRHAEETQKLHDERPRGVGSARGGGHAEGYSREPCEQREQPGDG